jgi:hypothetical protein
MATLVKVALASENGWVIAVRRLEQQHSAGRSRTYGRYQAFLRGTPIAGLSGFVCEAVGPGDNKTINNGKRIEPGRYPLLTHWQGVKYASVGYSDDLETAGALKMPAIRVGDTEARTDILIHPGHPPTPYLSSVGCFNPTGPLDPAQEMDFWESRARVIALLDSLRGFAPDAFATRDITRIPDAWLIVEGEPL